MNPPQPPAPDAADSGETQPSKIDWSTPYDEWLIPLLNRARHCGAIEFRAIPSVVQLHIDKAIAAAVQAEKRLLFNNHVLIPQQYPANFKKQQIYAEGYADCWKHFKELALLDSEQQKLGGKS